MLLGSCFLFFLTLQFVSTLNTHYVQFIFSILYCHLFYTIFTLPNNYYIYIKTFQVTRLLLEWILVGHFM